jgi:hypothetical protein
VPPARNLIGKPIALSQTALITAGACAFRKIKHSFLPIANKAMLFYLL